nr:MAG TPA: hypothetical protein [Caudoviricetes sp.]
MNYKISRSHCFPSFSILFREASGEATKKVHHHTIF